MNSFTNDYSEGAHPSILQALADANLEQNEGYGLDIHSLKATKLIREQVGDEKAEVIYLSGGTQTNLLAISCALRPHMACIAATTGHIAVHETGAIESTGHKVITIKPIDGKLTPALIEPVLVDHYFEHMVLPKMVYISNPTELGTVYHKKELEDLYSFCQSKGLILYCDGARLGCALDAEKGKLTIKDIYNNTDAFFIGGTKIGALLGEALVIKKAEMQEDIRYLTKQRGALLAKGSLLGIQFETLMSNGLYAKLSHKTNAGAQKIVKAMKELGFQFLLSSPTNQIFPILDNALIEKLEKKYAFYVWEKLENNQSAIRLVTSWATPEQQIDQFIEDLKNLQ